MGLTSKEGYVDTYPRDEAVATQSSTDRLIDFLTALGMKEVTINGRRVATTDIKAYMARRTKKPKSKK